MERELIPPQLQGNDTMNALATANDAAEACYKLTALLEDMEAQQAPAAQREKSRQLAANAADVSFFCITAATYLFMSTVCVESAKKENNPCIDHLDTMHSAFIKSASEARQALNDLAKETNAFLDSMGL